MGSKVLALLLVLVWQLGNVRGDDCGSNDRYHWANGLDEIALAIMDLCRFETDFSTAEDCVRNNGLSALSGDCTNCFAEQISDCLHDQCLASCFSTDDGLLWTLDEDLPFQNPQRTDCRFCLRTSCRTEFMECSEDDVPKQIDLYSHPTSKPTSAPSVSPSKSPSKSPTTRGPSANPTSAPSASPNVQGLSGSDDEKPEGANLGTIVPVAAAGGSLGVLFLAGLAFMVMRQRREIEDLKGGFHRSTHDIPSAVVVLEDFEEARGGRHNRSAPLFSTVAAPVIPGKVDVENDQEEEEEEE